jgi:glucan phosphoethanolaminetransferase (alkaline phosphatase superfamily)
MKVFWSGIADDRNYIDNWLNVDSLIDERKIVKWGIDNEIAKRVNAIISSSSGNFIVIFKHGSHIPYQDDFPPGGEVWQPSYETGNKFEIPDASRLNEVVNAYDNSLRYNIDSFFKNLVDDYSRMPNNTVILYTGDHGQTLFANGKASHGGDTKEEAMVPLFIVGKLSGPIDTNFKASHKNIYPTLLDLMNYPEELRERRFVISLLKAKSSDSKPRFFNPDLGKKIPFD